MYHGLLFLVRCMSIVVLQWRHYFLLYVTLYWGTFFNNSTPSEVFAANYWGSEWLGNPELSWSTPQDSLDPKMQSVELADFRTAPLDSCFFTWTTSIFGPFTILGFILLDHWTTCYLAALSLAMCSIIVNNSLAQKGFYSFSKITQRRTFWNIFSLTHISGFFSSSLMWIVMKM